MRALILLAAIAACLIFTAPARAGEVCNETSFMVDVAKAWRTASGVAAEGWMRIAPGGCGEIGPGPETDQYLYARSTPAYLGGVREWRGGLQVCVDETDFQIEGVADCADLGLESRGFRQLGEAERARTVLVELADFRDRAEEAGLQRLLQAAGYDIRVIDGYAGRRTRRQIDAFEADAGRSFGTDRAALMEALHARALERNENAGLRICNDADMPLAAAVSRAEGESYITRGWWRVEPGACAQPLSERLTAGEVFIHARLIDEGGMRTISLAQEAFCVAPGRFSTEMRTDCEEIGFEAAAFRAAPDPENGGVAVRLTSRDFEEAAP
ncbi:MAG: DUF1036 domain-containing protein [Oceanicaulis sp.]